MPESPGLKSIHLRRGLINPQAGDCPISVAYGDAGDLPEKTQAIVTITPKPVPAVAAYSQLRSGRNENWQRVKVGQETGLPVDILVTLLDTSRSALLTRVSALHAFTSPQALREARRNQGAPQWRHNI